MHDTIHITGKDQLTPAVHEDAHPRLFELVEIAAQRHPEDGRRCRISLKQPTVRVRNVQVIMMRVLSHVGCAPKLSCSGQWPYRNVD